jgi:hypothetical protein
LTFLQAGNTETATVDVPVLDISAGTSSRALNPGVPVNASDVKTSLKIAPKTAEKSGKFKDELSENLKGEFIKNLINNFDELVLNFLDKSARDAITQQKTFTDEKEFRRIKLAIENRVLYLLVHESHLSTTPVVAFFRQVVGVLANRYPYMFLEDPTMTVQGVTVRQFVGKGTGGLTGIRSLPKALQQKFARMLDSKHGVATDKKKKRDLSDGSTEHQVPKKKRKVYGIHSEKFYVKCTEAQETFIEELTYAETTEAREVLYSTHRKDLQNRLVTSNDMFSAVPGFFSSLIHAENHFEWLTGKKISTAIEKELPRQFRLVKCVVQKMCTTKEFKLHQEIAKIKGLEQNGSYTPEFVCLLRQLNQEWHKSAGGLLRFPSEPEEDSPHILCCDGIGSVKFDLHVEKKKIFTGLNFSEALRAFFCVAFIGNLHYPEDGEAVAILLQRKLAGINGEGNGQ